MEWVIAIIFTVAWLVWAAVYLARKALNFVPKIKALRELSEQVAIASNKVAELEATVSAISDDPAIHEARRAQLLRKRRQVRQLRERKLRLRLRDL